MRQDSQDAYVSPAPDSCLPFGNRRAVTTSFKKLLLFACLLAQANEASEGQIVHGRLLPLSELSCTNAPIATSLREIRGARSALSSPTVRLAYIVPSNRTEQPNAVSNLQSMALDAQQWFRDQMDRNGFGPKSIRLEMEDGGTAPAVHVRQVSVTDEYLRVDLFNRTLAAASGAGIALGQRGQVWLVVVESHFQSSQGKIMGGSAVGGMYGQGSGDNAGVALLGGDALYFWNPALTTDDRAYDGLVIPELGSQPLRENVSFDWFFGKTLSSVASTWRGACIHELGHALAELPHDFRNDLNANGNVMGNGHRGHRGVGYPAKYPEMYSHLSYSAALALNSSPYFGDHQPDSGPPDLSILSSGAVPVSNNQITVNFQASDASGLAAAWLLREGDIVADCKLEGLSVATNLWTTTFDAGVTNNFEIIVMDSTGRKARRSASLSPSASTNRAPKPFLQALPAAPLAGESLTLDASLSADHDHALPKDVLLVEWDVNNDGIFDTEPSTNKHLQIPLNSPGNFQVVARIINPNGAIATTAPVSVHAHLPSVTLSDTGSRTNALAWLSKVGFEYHLMSSTNLAAWRTNDLAVVRGDGGWMRQEVRGSAKAEFYRYQVRRASE